MLSDQDIDNQFQLLTLHRQRLQHYLQQEATLGRAFAPPGVSSGIAEARAQIQRVKEVLRDSGIAVEDFPDDELSDISISKKTTRASINPIEKPRIDLIELRRVLIDSFNKSELKDLCFELSIKYEDLEGDTLSDKARELIALMRRHNRLDELGNIVSRLRPGSL